MRCVTSDATAPKVAGAKSLEEANAGLADERRMWAVQASTQDRQDMPTFTGAPLARLEPEPYVYIYIYPPPCL